MKRRGERLEKRGEGRLIAAALAVCLALSLAVYFAGRPKKETVAPAHDVPEAVFLVEKVNLNRASAAEIAALPGVGEVLAGRIVEYRRQWGDFASLQELLNVQGIGEGRLQVLQEYIYLE